MHDFKNQEDEAKNGRKDDESKQWMKEVKHQIMTQTLLKWHSKN